MTFQTLKDDPKLSNIQFETEREIWPEIMHHDLVANNHWHELEKSFPEYQLFLMDKNDVVGFGNCMPFQWNYPLVFLPQKGWDWLFLKSLNDFEKNRKPNVLGGLQITIRKKYQGNSYSKVIINKIRETGKLKGLDKLIIPVRPVLKSEFPLMPMRKYIKLLNEKKEIYDPWLRAHIRLGAKIIGPCRKSMTIRGSVEECEKWIGKKFVSSGKYIIDGATSPLIINTSNNTGTYYDENVWVYHNLKNQVIPARPSRVYR